MQTSRLVAGLAGSLILLTPLAAIAPAQARVIETGRESVPVDDVVTDFCDVEGLTVHIEGTFEVAYKLMSRGADQLPYFMEHSSFQATFTNLANGKSVTERTRVLEKDLKVVQEGETFTILVLLTGPSHLKDSQGVVAANPGQIRLEIVIDNGGTPSDPTDDEFVADLGLVKGSTGRNDDYCEAFADALT